MPDDLFEANVGSTSSSSSSSNNTNLGNFQLYLSIVTFPVLFIGVVIIEVIVLFSVGLGILLVLLVTTTNN